MRSPRPHPAQKSASVNPSTTAPLWSPHLPGSAKGATPCQPWATPKVSIPTHGQACRAVPSPRSLLTILVQAAAILLAFAGILSQPSQAQVPQIINYQGRISVGPVNFDGTGQFKFALVNATGTTTYWSNDGSSTGGSEPTTPVSRPVSKGVYSVLLGDVGLTNMTAIPTSVFTNADVRLRVWFNNGTDGYQLLTPDQRIAAVGYAMIANTVVDGSVTSAKIANGAVGIAQLAADSGAAPAGGMMAYAGIAVPTGWLLCDGSAVSRANFSRLFSAIGTIYGSGDGATTFNLPDLRGRVPTGRDTAVNGTLANRVTTAGCAIDGSTLGAVGGSESRTTNVSVSQQPTFTVNSHEHSLSNSGYAKISVTLNPSNSVLVQRINVPSYSVTQTATNTSGATTSGTNTNAAGLGGVTDSAEALTTRTADVQLSNPSIPAMPPTMILNYIIKY